MRQDWIFLDAEEFSIFAVLETAVKFASGVTRIARGSDEAVIDGIGRLAGFEAA